MAIVNATRETKLPTERVWDVLRVFSDPVSASPFVKSAEIIGDKQSGLGAGRQCYFYDQTDLKERVIDWREGDGFTVEMYDFSMPLNYAVVSLGVRPHNGNESQIYMTMNYEVKFGPLGTLLNILLIRWKMKSTFQKILKSTEYYAATGKPVGDKMPDLSGIGVAAK